MSKKQKDAGKALTAKPGYDVGYGKPPAETRFKPGQSGNPKGRPKGSKNKLPGMHEERMKDIILDEAYRDINVRDGDRSVTIPMVQAIVRSMAVNAAKGQHRAQRLFAELLASVESSRKILHDEWLETAIGYKVDWERELARRKDLGITDLPEPLPHPDHVKIDLDEGTAMIVGPSTKKEKAQYDWLVSKRDEFEEELKCLKEQRATEAGAENADWLEREIEQVAGIVERLRDAIPK